MLIGLTGGMGSGKSTAASILKSKGFEHIDADAISRIVCKCGSPVLERLRDEFGASVINADGSLNRKEMAKIGFSDPQKTSVMNSIIQGAILDYSLYLYKKIKEEKGNDTAVIFDVPLLFEAGWDKYCDKIICITADTETRIARIKARDGISEEEIMKRLSLQIPDDEKVSRSDFVLDNSGSIEDFNLQLEEIFQGLIFNETPA